MNRTTSPAALAPTSSRPRGALISRHLLHKLFVYGLLVAGSILFIMPFLWMVSTSLKPPNEVFTYPPSFLPSSFQWQNYPQGWTTLPFTTFLRNSLIVTGANVIGNLLSCSLVAFGFARLRARGRDLLFLLVLATMMIPYEVTMVPRFVLFKELGWVNSLRPLIAPAWFGYPFFIFLLRQFFMSIPHELDEAAYMDGASNLRVFWNVILPLSKPALGAVAIFSFIGNWNNFLDPLVYLRSQDLFTIALGLNLFKGEYLTVVNQLMAVSILALLPILVIFFFAQKTFVQGITLSGMGGR
jgi:ABC-type glycerol-3-phosphate transport system permease component